jgi:hypothetical protein
MGRGSGSQHALPQGPRLGRFALLLHPSCNVLWCLAATPRVHFVLRAPRIVVPRLQLLMFKQSLKDHEEDIGCMERIIACAHAVVRFECSAYGA